MSAVPEVGADAAAGAGGRRWSFDKAVFDERSFELSVNGQPVDLERKSLEVLRQLLYRAGEVVTKDELFELVWPGRIVSESVPAKCVSRIREAIGDDAQAIIKTVHGYGYRLVASVKVETSRAAPVPTRLDLKAGDHPPLRPLWSLVRQLGAGGQGEIWLVQHDKTREERVYKFALDVAGLAAIKREITLSRFLRETLEGRDEFIRVLDWNLEEAPYYLELEHASGNLESWAEAQGGLAAVPLAVRLEIMAKVADALAAAHSVGVLHKDLKPSNVLIAAGSDGAPKVKLADFGSGGVLDPERLAAMGITRMEVTKSMMQGDMPATFMYLAPEVMAGQPATVQADVYSLGVMLYQMVIGDFRRPLAPGWEQRAGDPLLCEDIGLAVGDHAQRLIDASVLATRLRTLDERWRQRAADQEQSKRAEFEKQTANERARQAELAVARLRARRNWMLTSLSVLIVGFALSVGLYLDARRAWNEAAIEAASSGAVADFLSKDMFAVVGSRPLRDLTVKELLEASSATLANRAEIRPSAAAQIHAALGRAFLTVDAFAEAEQHLDKAVELYGQMDGLGSEGAVTTAALLVLAKSILGQAPEEFARFDAIQRSGGQLGAQHPALLDLKRNLGNYRLQTGDFTGAAAGFAELVAAGKSVPQPNAVSLGESLTSLGRANHWQGNFEIATSNFGEALSLLGSVPSSSPVAIVNAQLLLASTLVELERFGEAARALSEAETRIHAWVVDDNSSQMLVIQFVSAQLALREGRAREAIRILERTLEAIVSLQGDHSAEPRRLLAHAYLQAGRLAEAEEMMRKARDSAVRLFGPSTPWHQVAIVGLAEVVRERGKPGESRKVLAELDQAVFERLGKDHPFTADLHRTTGLTALAEGRIDEARKELLEASRIFELRYGSRHQLSQRARAELARVTSSTATVPN